MTTFVSVGNAHQSFERLFQGVLSNLDIMPKPIIVQCGHTIFKDPACNISKFYGPEEYHQLIKSSALLIMHAGGGSIIRAVRAGQRPVIMPRRKKYNEHTNDHQYVSSIKFNELDLIELALEPIDLKNAILRKLNYHPDTINIDRNTYAVKVIKNSIKQFEDLFRKKQNK